VANTLRALGSARTAFVAPPSSWCPPQSAATCFTVERSVLHVWEPGAHTHAVTKPCLESRWLTETGWREVDKRSLAVSSTNRRRGFSSPRSPDRRETAHRAGAGRARRRATANSLYKHDALEGRADAVRAWGLLGPTRAVSGHPRWADLRCGWPTPHQCRRWVPAQRTRSDGASTTGRTRPCGGVHTGGRAPSQIVRSSVCPSLCSTLGGEAHLGPHTWVPNATTTTDEQR
jgi:hypothetical protein